MDDPTDFGNDAKFTSTLTDEYRDIERFFLRRLRGDRDVAQDLTQEVFAKTVDYTRDSHVNNPTAFIFKVAANLLRDHLRHNRVDQQYFVASPLQPANEEQPVIEAVEALDAERVVIGRETLNLVLEALDELGERTRTIFILFRVDRMRQHDIGALFGISTSAVEKHIAKATAHLAKKIDYP